MYDKKLIKKMAAFSLISLSLLVLPSHYSSTVARNTYTYKPPKNPKTTKSRVQGSGSRGCNEPKLADVKLRLFAPDDHVGLTTSDRPTFLWYVATKSKVTVRFALVDLDPNQIEPVIELKQEVSQSGVVKLQLPPGTTISAGKTYQWTVAVVCNPKRPSQDIYAYAWIEKVSSTAGLLQKMNASNKSERAAIYADGGIWYDALAEAYRANPNSEYLLTLFSGLSKS